MEVLKNHTKYEYAAVATDMVIFTVREKQLMVLLIQMKKQPFTGMWAMPGGLIGVNESIDDAAKRILFQKTAMKDQYLEQFATFGEVNRDPFGRVVSVAYIALVPSDKVILQTTPEYADIAWFPVSATPSLSYDHAPMLEVAREQLKYRLLHSHIASSLLPEQFTLTELQSIYEAILGQKLDKRNFRKRILAMDFIKSTGKTRSGATHRPAELYRMI